MEQVMQKAQKMEQVMQNAQKVALPVFLRRGLDAFRVGEGGKKKYLLRTPWDDNIYEFEPWQFFVLEVLPGCDEYTKLVSVFEDRYGHHITKNEVEELFSLLVDRNLLGLAAISHPLVASYEKTRNTPIVVESIESLQEAASNRKAGESNISAGAASSEQQTQPPTAIHTDSNRPKNSGSAAQANQGPMPSGENKRMDLIESLSIKERTTEGYLARAVHKAQESTSSSKRRTSPHVENRPAATSPPAEAAGSNRRMGGAVPEPLVDLPAAKSKKSNGNAGSRPAAKSKKSNGNAESRPAADSKKSNRKAESKPPAETIAEPLPAGVSDAVGLDNTMRKKGWKLFNPTWLIKLLQPLFLPFKYSIYLLPLLLTAALIVCTRHAIFLEGYFKRLLGDTSFFEHALLGGLTVNLSATLVTALVAHTYRATVDGFCIVFLWNFFPRFMVRIGNVEQLLRRERIWLHVAPLMTRLALFSIGILVWFNTRTTHDVLAYFGFWVSVIAAISFIITVNPFVMSNGYFALAAFLDEPHLRGKSYKALLSKFRGNVYRESNSNVLVVFFLVSTLYTMAVTAAMLYIFNIFLDLDLELGHGSLLVIVFISLTLLWRMIKAFKKAEEDYERQVQFERWRNRTFPKVEDDTTEKKHRSPMVRFLTWSMLLLFIAALFLPYTYEPGGDFVILPNEQQKISAEVAGIIDKINYDGGEILKKGTVIGQLSYSDYEAQAKIYAAKIKQQQAAISELKAKPRPEELKLAESALGTQKTQTAFSKAKATRYEQLYKEGVISFEDLDDARRTYQVDLDQMQEKTANLELVKSGATEDEIAEAEAKLQSYQEQYDYYQQKIEQSILSMPFDGKLITLHLKQKIGSYLNKGEPLAVAEQTNQVQAEIKVPETDIGFVKENSKISFRFQGYHDESFYGQVKMIDAEVQDDPNGKVVKVIALLENKNERLKSGMTGYAKISSEQMPIWKVFSLAILRFFEVEVWSWLP